MNILPKIPSVVSSSSGELRMTTVQRFLLNNPANGTAVFDIDLGMLFIWNNGGWFQSDGRKLVLFGLSGADPVTMSWTATVDGDAATLTQEFRNVLMFPSTVDTFDNSELFGGSGATLDLGGLHNLGTPTYEGNPGISNILCLDNCTGITDANSGGGATSVQYFLARNCQSLITGYNISCAFLTDLSGCTSLPNYENFTNLPQSLILDDCTSILFININGSTNITTLSAKNNILCTQVFVYECPSLELVDVTGQTLLQNIDFDTCPAIKLITGLGGCTALQVVDAYNSTIKSLDFSGPDKPDFIDLDFNTCPDLTTVNLQSCIGLQSIYGYTCVSLRYLDATPTKAALQYCDISGSSPSNPSLTTANFANCSQLVTLFCNSLHDLTSVNVLGCVNLLNLSVQHDANITAIDLTDCIALTSFVGSDCAKLTSVIPPPLIAAGAEWDILNSALSGTSVNAIIMACNIDDTPGTIDLSGGTNAVPTGQAVARKAQLITAGWTITTN